MAATGGGEAQFGITTLEACQAAYRKHVLDDQSLGWDELGEILFNAICNEIGDEGYQNWLEKVKS